MEILEDNKNLPIIKAYYERNGLPYHNFDHIDNMLKNIPEDISTKPILRGVYRRLVSAILYHDIVYVAGRDDNEEKSVELFKQLNSGNNYDHEIVEKMIMATKFHDLRYLDSNARPITILLSQLIADLDLLSLAEPYDIFVSNTEKIRMEYFHSSDDEFYEGRANFFEKILEKDHIFQTTYFQDREALARANILRSLGEMKTKIIFRDYAKDQRYFSDNE